ncbi:putative nuclease HARBI1 [Trichoplusia ni]|uniref:Putative nuclease HARBI1 n=1 Tax=Trichoplusia ni TaxID=7111 RepID=A0A7E5VJK8_TRINI|nr:putative nuclease HARBI1 [Trichoplusia ni]
MDIFDIIEEEFDEFFDRVTGPRREPIFRNRSNNMEKYDDTDFKMRFRLSKVAVTYVFSLIQDTITAPTSRNYAVTPMDRLLLTLRYYATGSFLTVVGDFTGVSKASASRIVKLVSHAIAQLRLQFIKFPTNTNHLQEEFYDIARFPKVIAAIDCTHIPIKSPGGENAENFRNRQSFFSFNVQALVTAKLKIIDIVARWPGATHDQTIFNNSFIKQQLMNREFGPCVVLGDNGYENNSYLLTPLSNPRTPAEQLYNESQIRTRNVVERTFGVWKNRFPVLTKKIILHVSRVQAVIVACAVLHNIAIDMGDQQFEENWPEESDNGEEYHSSTQNTEDSSVRSNLINDYFASLIR